MAPIVQFEFSVVTEMKAQIVGQLFENHLLEDLRMITKYIDNIG